MSSIAAPALRGRTLQRRDEAVYMFCGLWMITGLYIDGWAHQANKPETFFTPWHLVLYSGFGAIVVYSGLIALRDARSGEAPAALIGDDRTTTLGGILFAVGGGGDFLWHEIFGTEVDIEALISPTHLLLMIGGLLMVTMPVRSALRSAERVASVTVVASIGLALAVVSFFLMYLSPWSFAEEYGVRFDPEDTISELSVEGGMANALVFTALFAGAVLWAASRWRLPAATATVMFTGVAIGQAGLEGFESWLPILAATAAGVTADVLRARDVSLPITGALTALVMWSTFFALLHVESGVEWTTSLWSGAVVFATLTGYAMGHLVNRHPA